MKAGKRIVRSIDTPVMQSMSQCSDPIVVKAVKAWNNPDRFMDSKLDYESVVARGINRFKNIK